MKKIFSSIRMGMVTFSFILLAGLLFSACRKSNDDINNNTQVAGLMAFHLATDKPFGVGITLSNNALPGNAIPYAGYSGLYYNIYPGTRNVRAYDVSNTTAAITNSDHTFDINKYYSLFVVGANGVYSNVVSQDNFNDLTAKGKAYVRYINAIPDSSNLKVTITTTTDAAITDDKAHFKSVSPFTQVTPGQITIDISNEKVKVARTISVEQHIAYTILLIGTPGEADPTKAVQIKFVENGRLSL
jgi:hypothetical protein